VTFPPDIYDRDNGFAASIAMLDVIASVGGDRFSVTLTNLADEKVGFLRNESLESLKRKLPQLLDRAAGNQHNVHVRPQGPVTLIQLDDCPEEILAEISASVFLILETSPGSFQAWVALASPKDEGLARRLKKGCRADPSASGSTRIAGSFNFKEKRRNTAGEFPRVRFRAKYPGRMTTAAELEGLGVVAPVEAAEVQRTDSFASTRRPTKWPSWKRCLEGAPLSQSRKGQPRQSIADYTWCMIAANWGWSVEDIARRLMHESPKARENGKAYARRTADQAAEAAARNRHSLRN